MSSSKGGIGRFSRKKAASSTATNNASTTTTAPTANKNPEPAFDDSSQIFESSFHSNIVMENQDTFDFGADDGNFDLAMDIPCIEVPEFQPTNDDFGATEANATEATVPPFKGRSLRNDDTTPSGGDAGNVVPNTNDDVDASGEKPCVSDETTLVATAEGTDVFPEAGKAADVPNSTTGSYEATDVPVVAENMLSGIQHQEESQSVPTKQVHTFDRMEGLQIKDNSLAVPSSGKDGTIESSLQKEPYAGPDIQGGDLEVTGEEVPVESSTRKSVDVSDVTPEKAIATSPKDSATPRKADKRATAPAPSTKPNDTEAQVETAPPPPSTQDSVVTPSPAKNTTGVSSTGGPNPDHTATILQLVDQGPTDGQVVTPETNDNPSSETFQRIQGLKTAFRNRTTDGGNVNFEDAHNDFMEYLQASTEKVESGEKKLIDLEVELVTADSLLLMYQADLQDLLYSFDKINRKGLKALKKCGQRG